MLQKTKQLQFSTDANVSQLEDTFAHQGISIPELRRNLTGRVILPSEADYDPARVIFSAEFDRHPALIVRVANAQDISYVVSLASESGLELGVRSGGHSIAGYSLSEGGFVIDLRDMNSLQIDPVGRTAWVETGLTTIEYINATDIYGLATGFGDTGTVGVGGITLGGGIGYLVRKHGLTIDSLLAADIVTADGQHRRTDADHYPDLFWAIRGGGGNFGVATRFHFQLQDVSQMLGGMLILPATPEVIAGFIAEAEAAPDELTTIANIMPAPAMPFLPKELHGKLILIAMLAYVGQIEDGMRVVAPFRKLANPLADMIHPLRYPKIYRNEEDMYHKIPVSRMLFLDKIHREHAEMILDHLNKSDAEMRFAQLRVLGGAMARISNDATAFAHRQSKILVHLLAICDRPEDHAVQQAWADDFAAALQQEDHGVYVNFLAGEGAKLIHDAYPGQTWDRLQAVKARFDPTDLFSLNLNIPPKE